VKSTAFRSLLPWIAANTNWSAINTDSGAGTVVLTATNTLPNSTNIDTFNNLTISAGTTTLSRGTTVGGDLSISAGVGSLTVKRPTASVTGAVDVQIDLAAESKTWLQLNRNAGAFTQNPLGRAAFGLYGSQPGNFIYFRENY
jgi:hypothetical protein